MDKRRFPTLKVIAAAAFLLAVGACDVAAKEAAESKLAGRVGAAMPGQGPPKAHIDAPPFLFVPTLLATGSVGDVEIEARRVRVAGLPVSRARIEMKDLRVDRGDLPALLAGKPKLERARRTSVSVELTGDDLSKALGYPVAIRGGAVEASGLGLRVRAEASIRAGALVLSAPPLPEIKIRLPKDLLPCAEASARVEGEALVLACAAEGLPPSWLGIATR